MGEAVRSSRAAAELTQLELSLDVKYLFWLGRLCRRNTFPSSGSRRGKSRVESRVNPPGAAGLASFRDPGWGCTAAPAQGSLKPRLAKEGKHQVWHSGNSEQGIFGQSAVLQQCYNSQALQTPPILLN